MTELCHKASAKKWRMCHRERLRGIDWLRVLKTEVVLRTRPALGTQWPSSLLLLARKRPCWRSIIGGGVRILSGADSTEDWSRLSALSSSRWHLIICIPEEVSKCMPDP